MEVKVLRATDQPERLVCQAARGDYFEGYVGDTEFEELMENVAYNGDDVDGLMDKARDEYEWSGVPQCTEEEIREQAILQARMKSFIEKQLARGHYGPWEHPQITFAVKGVSRVTMAQITRHRHITFDIQSMRYANFEEQEIVTPRSLTDSEHFTREQGMSEMSTRTRQRMHAVYERQVEQALESYQNMVNAGVPKEDARFVLPLGTTVNMTFSGNARTFLHLLDMRRKANAQWEIRELSEALLDELFEWMPFTYEYYADHGPNKLSP